MSIRSFAAVFGVVFVLAGLAGFVPALSPAHVHPGLVVTAESRQALGLFPVNAPHDLVHLAFGVWGLMAARSAAAAVVYAKGVAVIYGLLTVLGFFPVVDDVFGLVPIYGNDIWLHAGLAAIAAYFGFVRTGRATVTA